ncbi:MAG: hypothetical protein IR153_04785 [Flavobacterium sp.]|nr:hypothetical protein [Flavobacterium sp.]
MKSQFDQIIKDIIIISSEKDDQINLIGNGNVGTEMLINLGISNQNLNVLLKQKLINENQKAQLEKFQNYIDFEADLDDDLDSEKWKETRIIAKELLAILNVNTFSVFLDKSGEFWEAKLNKMNNP